MINRFSSFPTEKVKIIKASGLIIDNVDAFMSNNMFLIEDGRLDIEENDIISRSLPNGKTEGHSASFASPARHDRMLRNPAQQQGV